MRATLVRALGTAGALAVAVVVGYAAQPAGAVAPPASDCVVQAPTATPAPITPMARGHLVPM